ncbi:flagellar basal body rod protein FlgB [Texcoconibacillus texcoconensis]|uniref:Flagellar basal body rod protein FlgB n=1 Tax=Texcoconibacillus texcoconensis TaxID=1095777 RepID=A0A840QL39_9BACI|nr:flagellar basal body rod protein FlgB [Texcoconibacillus texcoconensis]MBB5172083.1 flagellar basal-body rod protein FlgB [Texcoconibacillus texcoconensis]
MDIFGNSTNQLLENALKATTTRQKTIAHNIANVDTPNYSAKKTVFNHELNQAMDNERLQAHRTNEGHLSFGGIRSDEPQVVKRNNTMYNHNGNNVDIDHEMTALSKNQINHNALVDQLNGRFNKIQIALGQGR